MATPPQALFHFNGIKTLINATYTLAHGVSPSIFSFYLPTQTTPLPKTGTVTIQFGSEAPVIFPDCKVIQADFTNVNGEERWAMQVADTRWRWEGGIISGEYNVRDDAREIRPETTKTCKELITLLFKEMGVTQFNLDAVPGGQFPECIWDVATPARELATLLERIGCCVVLQPNNQVVICKSGEGALLPKNNRLIEIQQTFESLDVPEALIGVGGKILYQVDLLLEPVGIEPGGEIRKLDDLSYKPAIGWDYYDFGASNQIKDKKISELAKSCVYRLYRPIVPFKLLDKGVIKDLRRILPLSSRQVKTKKVLGVQENLAAQVYGVYATGGGGYRNNLEDAAFKAAAGAGAPPPIELTGNLDLVPAEEWTRSFSIDEERGLVQFSEPAFIYKRVDEIPGGPPAALLPHFTNYLKHPALLFLRTSFSLRDEKTRGFEHYALRRELAGPKQGAKPKHVFYPDVVYKIHLPTLAAGAIAMSNLEECKKQMDFYLDGDQRRLQGSQPASATYAGFAMVKPDGAIKQVTWSISDGGAPTTRISRNREETALAITYEQKRQYERVAKLLEGEVKKERPRGPK